MLRILTKAAFCPTLKKTVISSYKEIHMVYTVTLIPGDGIGPDVTTAARNVLEATGIKFTWEIARAGAG